MSRTIFSLFHSRSESVNVGLGDRQGKLASVSQNIIIVCNDLLRNHIRASCRVVRAVAKRLTRYAVVVTTVTARCGFNVKLTHFEEGDRSSPHYEGPSVASGFTNKALTVYSDLSDCLFHVCIVQSLGSSVKNYFQFISAK